MRRRPIIVSVEDDVDGDDARVTVTLDWDDRSWHGHAIGSSGTTARLAGEAALDAVERLTHGSFKAELLAVATTDVGAARVALAQVQHGVDDVLVGTALQQEPDGGLAAVRAVMDAINRKLERDL